VKKRFKKAFISLCTVPLFVLPFITQANATEVNRTYSSNNEPKLSFAVISDIHLRAGVDDLGNPYDDQEAENKFRTTLQDLNRINPKSDGLVINGDLTVTGEQTDYDSMNKVLKEIPHPKNTLFAIGNHEFYSAFRLPSGVLSLSTFPNGVTEQDCIHRFLDNTGMPSLYYDKVIKGYHFIVLGSEQSRITKWENGDQAVLSDKQLQWLDNELKHTSPDKPTFVFLHQPIPHTVAGSGNDIVHSEKLVNILDKYPQVIFFSGHSHLTLKDQPGTMYHEKFTAFNDSAVRNPETPDGKLVGDSEGLYVQVYKDKVVVNGRDFTNKSWINQYTVHIPHLSNQNE
jgi:Icc protein